ncbi:U3 small nucleolar RNA-associated protein 14 homolog A [Megachile rotundata]|uniref:U3 small nucleolar RNA-associated protein 14 homolog A n=1 Tax=Megachile rotundata TaxID=143995 RepID=UPI000615377C|nr:PREDICTED: U3 small nucleolar RNA-associated protein 14 homolog A [Megachile rotundata]
MSDLEFLDDTEQDVSESHSKLLDAVSQLDKGQRVKKAERSEPTLEVSEFHLVKSGISDVDTVQVRDLAKILGKKGHHLDVTKTLESAKKKVRILKKPLEKPAAERIKRIVGFENIKKEVKKWNAIITRNRTAEALQFPLHQPSMKLEPSTEFVQKFRLRSELEKELEVLEPQKENIEQKPDKFKLTLQEIIMKRNEAARIRAQQSYKEAKAHRQNKIKSKKFHRVQKKEQIKLQLKEFEQLQKTDPDAALEKLEQLDRSRAEERMSLRHKNTGKWAKSKQIMAKYDKETRQELSQQLSISRELTQKLKKPTNSSDEEEVEEEDINDNTYVRSSNYDKENPWISNVKTAEEIDQFISSYRKYWDDQNNQLKNKQLDATNMNKIEVETKQDEISSENLKSSNISEDYSAVSKAESSKIQCNGEIQKEKSNNQKTSSEHLKSFSTFQDSDEANKIELSKKQNHEKNYITEGHNNEITERNLCKDSVKRKLSGTNKIIDKKARLQKSNLNNIMATSSWNVESLKNDHDVSLTSTISNSEKINEVFDLMEDKMNDQIKLKLQRVNQKINKVKGKSKSKTATKYKTDNFDGLEIKAKNQKPIIDSALIEGTNNNNLELDIELENAKNIKNNSTLSIKKPNASEIEIDPNKYINVKPKQLMTDLPADISGGTDMLDDTEDNEEGYNVINEAFADDDVVEEFRKEKEEEVEKSRPKDIDLTLPGWGSWGGKNIKISKRKKKRFVLKIPKDAPRKDENKGDVIIFEEDKPKMKEHLVNELPHPFTTVQDYEASLRMPIGRNFVPEISFQKLIKPPIKTTMGKVIEPMNDDVLIKKDGNQKRTFLPKEKKQKKKKKIK